MGFSVLRTSLLVQDGIKKGWRWGIKCGSGNNFKVFTINPKTILCQEGI